MSARPANVPSAVLVRLALSPIAGLLVFAGFPPRPFWFLAPIGLALLTLVLTDFGRGGLRIRSGFGYGYLAGLGFLLPLLPWIGEFVGPVPWLALSAVEALFIGAFGALTILVSRLPWAPLWIAAVWSLTEWLRSSVPFGGFPWGRLAFGQSEGWLLPLAALGGAPLLSFAVALTGAGLAFVVIAILRREQGGKLVGAAAAALVASAVALLVPWLSTPDSRSGTVTVAAIQGSVPRLGLDFNAQRKQVLDNHVAKTLELAAEVDAGRVPQPDLVVWPENSSDIDPLRNEDAAVDISRASESIGAPILVGAVLVNDTVLPNGRHTTTNSVLVWNGEDGPDERHDKKIIQPFGEYLPYRDFFSNFSSYADRAGNFVPGHGDGVVHAAGIPVGIATCYEVAFDRAFQQSVDAGAQILAVPTNNATFGDTEMTYQQLAMSKVRAVEHGRAVVVAATSGVSAIIGPDGTTIDETELFVPAALVSELPLRTETTIASRLGSIPEVFLCICAAGAIAAAIIRPRRTKTPTDRV